MARMPLCGEPKARFCGVPSRETSRRPERVTAERRPLLSARFRSSAECINRREIVHAANRTPAATGVE